MKNVINAVFLSAITIIVVFSSCVNNNVNSSKYNEQQSNFDKFLADYRKMSHAQKNDIQKKEFMNKFENDLFKYVDSVKLLVNWRGQIKDIKTREINKNSTSIEFYISYKPEQYREVKFKCLYTTPTDSLPKDHIYNSVKNISNYSTVFFDGIIRTSNKGNVKYYLDNPGSDLNIPYPDYEFFIVEVGTTNRGDTLSTNLQKAIEYSYKITEPLKLNYLKKISNKEKEARWKALEPKFNSAKAKLTKQENEYLTRLNQALTLNFLYGD